MVKIKAYAKLNLTLGISGLEGGYHMLDSLVCTVDVFDLIKLKKRKDNLVNVEMHGMDCETLPPEKNNAVKAAEAYIKRFKTCGADIIIYKNIPVGAGMGGSSADVAGVLRGLSRLYGEGSESQLKEIADSLGSDTGYLLTGGFARLSGRGEKISAIEEAPQLNFLVLLPKSGVPTGDCYSLYDSLKHTVFDGEMAVKALESGDKDALGRELFNALYASAVKINPDVKRAYDELLSFSPLGVNMTGSGSGVFALFENAEMCAWAKSRYSGKFDCIQTKSVVPRI